MIYRIAIGIIVDGVWKFSRYATDEEMLYLRINANGKVEMLTEYDVDKNNAIRQSTKVFVTGEWVAEDDYYSGSCYAYWLDVSETHRVEWGMLTGDKSVNKLIPIYDGDIYVDWNTGMESKSTKPDVFELLRRYNNLHPDQFPMIEIIGNVNENPELLEDSDVH